jgi:release factor glutamine methyltransferase
MDPAGLDLDAVTRRLAAAGCIAPAEEAAALTRAAAGDAGRLEDLVGRRGEGEPLAWLTGSVEFAGVEVAVSPGVYVPRPQTEPLARRAASLIPAGGVAVDLCTGAGAIAAVMRAAVPDARVVATELDDWVIECTRRNGIEVFEGFLDDPLPVELEGRVDVMTAVVPYVPRGSIRLLPRDVQAYEPRVALDGGPAGTDFLEEVVRRAPRWLRPGGWIFLELGGDQAEPIGSLMARTGFDSIEVLEDEDGDPRGAGGRLGVASNAGTR